MIPTSGDASKTVCTFFINNGRRYLAWGVGLFYVPIPNDDYFNAIKDTLQRHDIPTQEIGDQDTRVYGLELVGRQDIHDAVVEGVTEVLGSQEFRVQSLYQNDENIGKAIERARVKLVRAKDDPNGAIYAVSDTSFEHIVSGAALDAGVVVGMWGSWPSVIELPAAQVQLLAQHLGGTVFEEPVVEASPTGEPVEQ